MFPYFINNCAAVCYKLLKSRLTRASRAAMLFGGVAERLLEIAVRAVLEWSGMRTGAARRERVAAGVFPM